MSKNDCFETKAVANVSGYVGFDPNRFDEKDVVKICGELISDERYIDYEIKLVSIDLSGKYLRDLEIVSGKYSRDLEIVTRVPYIDPWTKIRIEIWNYNDKRPLNVAKALKVLQNYLDDVTKKLEESEL